MRKASPKPERPIVFISFASTDVAMAEALYDRLNNIAGDAVELFLAQRSLPIGGHWPSHVEQRLEDATCVVVVLSEASLASSWVLFEAGVAHGRGVEVIPLALAGFNIEQHRPPLSFLQAIVVTSHDELNRMLARIEKAVAQRFAKRFRPADHAAIVAKAVHPEPQLLTRPLLTRPDIFRAATRLIERCHINSTVLGATSLVHPKDSTDKYVRPYVETLARKCGEAARIGGHMKYHVVIGVRRDGAGQLPTGTWKAIAERVEMFRRFGALACLRMRESHDTWSMNLLLVDTNDAILGFPEGGQSSRLQYGVHISGSHLVAPMVHWYQSSLTKGTKRLGKSEFLRHGLTALTS